jgi:hypothetical protein
MAAGLVVDKYPFFTYIALDPEFILQRFTKKKDPRPLPVSLLARHYKRKIGGRLKGS